MPTENGWEPSPRIEPDSPLLVWRQVPGSDVTIQVRDDDAGTAMLAYAADYHLTVEPLRDADSACYTPENSVWTSNHKNATAFDLNWNSHPFQTRGTFTLEQLGNLRKLQAYYAPWMFWAGDWDDPVDEMHHQLNYGTYADPNLDPVRDAPAYQASVRAQAAKLSAWVQSHIRPDGFSTYRHDALPGMVPPAPAPVPAPAPAPVPDPRQTAKQAAMQALYDAVPEIATVDDAGPLVNDVMLGMALSRCTTPRRAAMWLAEIGEESGGFVYTEEIAKDGRYAPYIGRTWIQITWQENYAEFGAWCVQQGFLQDANYFVNNPATLADDEWRAVGPAWYITVKEPRFLEFADAGNVEDASKAINAPAWIGDPTKRANGIDDRIARYQQAIALGDELLALVGPPTPAPAPTTGGGPLDALTPEEQHQLLDDVAWIREQMDVSRPDWGTDADLGTDSQGQPNNLRTALAAVRRAVAKPAAAAKPPRQSKATKPASS